MCSVFSRSRLRPPRLTAPSRSISWPVWGTLTPYRGQLAATSTSPETRRYGSHELQFNRVVIVKY